VLRSAREVISAPFRNGFPRSWRPVPVRRQRWGSRDRRTAESSMRASRAIRAGRRLTRPREQPKDVLLKRVRAGTSERRALRSSGVRCIRCLDACPSPRSISVTLSFDPSLSLVEGSSDAPVIVPRVARDVEVFRVLVERYRDRYARYAFHIAQQSPRRGRGAPGRPHPNQCHP